MDKENEDNSSKRKELAVKNSVVAITDKKNASASKKQKQQHLKPSLSEGAVDKMLRGDAFSGPFIVGVNYICQNGSQTDNSKVGAIASIFDTEHETTAWFHQTLEAAKYDYYYIIRVLGYVTSTANCVSEEFNHELIMGTVAQPFLFITHFEVISKEKGAFDLSRREPWEIPKMSNRRVDEDSDSYLQESIIPSLSPEAMIGLERRCFGYEDEEERDMFLEDQLLISDFLSYHESMTGMLSHFTGMLSNSSFIKTTTTTLVQQSQAYKSACTEFSLNRHHKDASTLKLDLDKYDKFIGCITNTFRCEGTTDFREFFKHAMEHWNAAFYSESETPIDTAYSPVLCDDNLKPFLGLIDSFSRGQSEDRPLFTIEFLIVAIIYSYVMDTGPFPDKHAFAQFTASHNLNSKSHSGILLILNWFGDISAADDCNYEYARWTTKRNLSLVYRGDPCRQRRTLVEFASIQSGMYAPLVYHLYGRAVASIKELGHLLENKHQSYLDSVRTKAIRSAREEAAAGSCLICFDDSPNMLTVCCSKAVHWDCMSKWLKAHESCPQCRGSMPAKLAENQGGSDEGNPSDELREVARRFSTLVPMYRDSLRHLLAQMDLPSRNAENSEEVTNGGAESDSDSSSVAIVRRIRVRPGEHPSRRRRINPTRRVHGDVDDEGDAGSAAVDENEEGDEGA